MTDKENDAADSTGICPECRSADHLCVCPCDFCGHAVLAHDDGPGAGCPAKDMTPEAATELLYEAGCEAKREGADLEHSAKFFETMIAYADPEYVEAAEVMGEDALECFERGLGMRRFTVKVRRVVVETAEIEIEAADEDEATEAALDTAQESAAWASEPSDDSDFEITDVEETE